MLEIMPTSGGSSYAQRGARSGVGDGDALVAAQQNANSFGNVDTDLFVDSPEPSLYDMFSEQFGEPRAKKNFKELSRWTQLKLGIKSDKSPKANAVAPISLQPEFVQKSCLS